MSAFETPRKTSRHGFGERGDAPRGGQLALGGIQVVAVGRDDTPAVAQHEVLAADAQREEEPRTGDGCRAGAVHHHAHPVEFLAGEFRAVEQCRRGDDRRAVLVVVHHRDIQLLTQARLDLEAFRGLDVLEVDAAEGRGDGPDGPDECLGIGLRNLDVEGVESGEGLEQHAFALHDRLGGQRADVAQAEDCRTVRNDGHEVALARVAVCVVRVFGNGQRGGGDARRVGQRKIFLCMVGFGRDDPDLAGAPFAVVAECRFGEFVFRIHSVLPFFRF